MGLINIKFLNYEKRINTEIKSGNFSSILVGMAFGFGWTPCIGPILGSILALASIEQSLNRGILLLVFYSLGLALPFIASGYLIQRFMVVTKNLKSKMITISRVGGGLLLITGILMITNQLQALGFYILKFFPILQKLGIKMKIYQIDCSARKEGSTSRMLAKKILDKVKKDNDEVIYRDLDDEMLFISGLTESGMKIPENEQTDEHKKMFELSDKLVSELKECDVIIISVPIYNFGPPATLKAWADLAARVKLTFKYGDDGRRKGLLEDKQVYLVITSGGTKIQGEEDFLTPWLIHMLNFFGIKKIDIVAADQMALDYEKSIKNAEEKIKELFKD